MRRSATYCPDLNLPTLLFFLCLPSICLSWPAQLVSVADGDTITVLHSGAEEKIRLYGIDTPEKKQEYGQQAKALTTALIAGRNIDVKTVVDGKKNCTNYGEIKVYHLVDY